MKENFSHNPIYELDSNSGDLNSIARLALAEMDWSVYHPNEPFLSNVEQAIVEYAAHRATYFEQRAEWERDKAKKLEAENTALSNICRNIGEERNNVILIDDGERYVDWNEILEDPETKMKIGSPRELLAINWARGNLDPRIDSQRQAFLNTIKNDFHGFSRLFTFWRKIEVTLPYNTNVPMSQGKHEKTARQRGNVYIYRLKLEWKV